jgi:hypothetical protein
LSRAERHHQQGAEGGAFGEQAEQPVAVGEPENDHGYACGHGQCERAGSENRIELRFCLEKE